MKISKKRTLTILLVVIATTAIFATWYYGFVSTQKRDEINIESNTIQASNMDESETLANSSSDLENLRGDAFDEAFIAGMLAHHDGAVSMAEQAQAMTAHDEIRTFASNIMMAQGQEIAQMVNWQKDWGYEKTMFGGHMSHGGGGMDMAGDMVEMSNALANLTGEEYDKEFLKQMIIHHEQAVEMAKPAATNAKHDEIKQLAENIIKDQDREIQQMRQWQKEWGYL